VTKPSDFHDAGFCLTKAHEYVRKAARARDPRMKSALEATAREFVARACRSAGRVRQVRDDAPALGKASGI
jgi:hypothetical protein